MVLVFVFVAIDSLGVGIPISISWIINETTACIFYMLRQFLTFVGNAPILSVMTDDSTSLQAALCQEMPSTHNFLCR